MKSVDGVMGRLVQKNTLAVLVFLASCSAASASILGGDPIRIERPVTGLNGTHDSFAASIARIGGHVLVGAPQDYFDESGSRGSIYSFRKEGGTDWQVAGVVYPMGIDVCGFGEMMAASDEALYSVGYSEACAGGFDDGSMLFRVDLDTLGHPTITHAIQVEIAGEPQTVMDLDASNDAVVVSVVGPVNTGVSSRLLAYAHNLAGSPQLIAQDTVEFSFNGAVSTSGDWIAAGCFNNAIAPDLAGGCVALYTRSGIDQPWAFSGRLTAPDGIEASTFGNDVVLRGSRMFVGAPALLGSSDSIPGTVTEFVLAQNGWEQASIIAPANGIAGDAFGRQIMLDDGELLIFAPERRVSVDRQRGALYRYCLEASWVPCGFIEAQAGEEDWLTPGAATVLPDEILVTFPAAYNPDATLGAVGRLERSLSLGTLGQFHPGDGGGAYDAFGLNVAIDGDLMVVGAPGYHTFGAIFIYRHVGDHWLLEYVQNGDYRGPNCAGFASAVAIRVGMVAVANGCPNASDDAFGYIYLYAREALGWNETGRERIAASAGNEGFGSSLLLTDVGIVYGAPIAAVEGIAAAGVVNLLRDGGSGYVRTTFTAPEFLSPGQFGAEIAATSAAGTTTLAVSGGGWGRQDVQIFDLTSSSLDKPVLRATLMASEPEPNAGSQFGASLALDGKALLVGAPSQRCSVYDDPYSGVVYRFERVAGAWQIRQRICSSDKSVTRFGASVALVGQSGVISSADSGGALWEFDRESEPWMLVADRTGLSYSGGLGYDIPIFASANHLVAAAPWALHPETFNTTGAVSVFRVGALFSDDFEILSDAGSIGVSR